MDHRQFETRQFGWCLQICRIYSNLESEFEMHRDGIWISWILSIFVCKIHFRNLMLNNCQFLKMYFIDFIRIRRKDDFFSLTNILLRGVVKKNQNRLRVWSYRDFYHQKLFHEMYAIITKKWDKNRRLGFAKVISTDKLHPMSSISWLW